MYLRIVKLLLSLYILFLPVFRYYQLPGGQNLFLLLANILAFITLGNKINVIVKTKSLFYISLVFFWIIVTSTFSYQLSSYSHLVDSSSVHNLIVLCDNALIAFICFWGGIDYDDFIRIYKYLCCFFCIYILFQLCNIHIPGVTLNGKIPFLNVSEIYLRRGDNFGVYPMGLYTRYSSCFIEPSHFAQYLTPFLCFCLFGYKDIIKKNLYIAFIISILMVMSISGTSIAIVALVWLYYHIINLKGKDFSKILIFVLFVIFFIFVSYFALQHAGLMEMIKRMSDSDDSKFADRIGRGFLVFYNLPMVEKLFGIGFQCIYPASIVFDIEEGYNVLPNVRNYVNDIASLLLSFGLVFFFQILNILYHFFKGADKLEKSLYISSFAIFLSEATFGVLWLMIINMCIAGYKQRNTMLTNLFSHTQMSNINNQ